MKKKWNQEHIEVPFLRRWFPDLPEEEMRKAEDIYIRYLDIRLRIFERGMQKEKPSADGDESPLPLES